MTPTFSPSDAPRVRQSYLGLYPLLTAYFGVSPLELLEWPRWLVQLYLEQLPVIQAERQLNAIQAAAFPYYKENTQSGIIRDLERLLDRHRARPRLSKEQVAFALESMGIGFAEAGDDLSQS